MLGRIALYCSVNRMRVDLEKSIWMGGEKIDERDCLGCEKYIIEGGEELCRFWDC